MHPERPGIDAPAPPDAQNVHVTGTITKLGTPPAFVSGRLPATQTLSLEVLSAASIQPGQHLDIDVLVMSDSPFVKPGSNGVPALDADQLKPGVVVSVRISSVNGRYRLDDGRASLTLGAQ